MTIWRGQPGCSALATRDLAHEGQDWYGLVSLILHRMIRAQSTVVGYTGGIHPLSSTCVSGPFIYSVHPHTLIQHPGVPVSALNAASTANEAQVWLLKSSQFTKEKRHMKDYGREWLTVITGVSTRSDENSEDNWHLGEGQQNLLEDKMAEPCPEAESPIQSL